MGYGLWVIEKTNRRISNIECRMSNVEGWYRFALTYKVGRATVPAEFGLSPSPKYGRHGGRPYVIKWTEFLPSTFIIQYSIFDIILFILCCPIPKGYASSNQL